MFICLLDALVEGRAVGRLEGMVGLGHSALSIGIGAGQEIAGWDAFYLSIPEASGSMNDTVFGGTYVT